MGKSVSYYRRRFASVAGPLADVSAYRRSEDHPIRYGVTCRLCLTDPFAGSRICGRAHGRGLAFHDAMRSWVVHLMAIHPGEALPRYTPKSPITPDQIEVVQLRREMERQFARPVPVVSQGQCATCSHDASVHHSGPRWDYCMTLVYDELDAINLPCECAQFVTAD